MSNMEFGFPLYAILSSTHFFLPILLFFLQTFKNIVVYLALQTLAIVLN